MQPSFAQGNITTQNLNPNSGVPTAGSFVQLPLTQDYDTLAIQVTGTYTGALSIQASLDGVNWKTLGGLQALTDINTAVQSATIPSAAQSIYQVDITGFQQVRVTALAAVTGTAVVSLVGSQKNGIVGIDTPLALAANQTVNATTTPANATDFALTSAATTNATSVKASAGNLFEITADNFTAAAKFLKLYRKASAPTVGTDVPILTVPIPANGFVQLAFGAQGKRFLTGIAYALTGAQAVADTTALAAGDVHVHGSYL